MKLQSLSGQEYSIQPKDYRVYKNDTQKKSSLHLAARELIRRLFPLEVILEEVPAKLHAKKVLYVDFLIPARQLVIEVDGVQHLEKVSFFHKTDADFEKGVNNDNLKQNWSEENNFTLIRLPYNRIEDWRDLLVG